jgi:hypothetical protein
MKFFAGIGMSEKEAKSDCFSGALKFTEKKPRFQDESPMDLEDKIKYPLSGYNSNSAIGPRLQRFLDQSKYDAIQEVLQSDIKKVMSLVLYDTPSYAERRV